MNGYIAQVQITGVGYSMTYELSKRILSINMGNKLPVQIRVPDQITIEIKNENELIAKANNLSFLTQFVHSIRQLKPAYKDKYKQKGFGTVHIGSAQKH